MSEHDYHLLDLDAHVDDPWPMYTYLREQAPLYWDQRNELWAVSRQADIVAMSTDTDTFTSGEGALANIPGDPWGDVWINGKRRGAAPLKNVSLKPG